MTPLCRTTGTRDRQRSLGTEVLWKIPKLNGSRGVGWGGCSPRTPRDESFTARLLFQGAFWDNPWQCSMLGKALSLAGCRHHTHPKPKAGPKSFSLLHSAVALSTEIAPRLCGAGTQNALCHPGTALPAPDTAPSLAGGAKTSSKPCHWELCPRGLNPSLAKEVLQSRQQHQTHRNAAEKPHLCSVLGALGVMGKALSHQGSPWAAEHQPGLERALKEFSKMLSQGELFSTCLFCCLWGFLHCHLFSFPSSCP